MTAPAVTVSPGTTPTTDPLDIGVGKDAMLMVQKIPSRPVSAEPLKIADLYAVRAPDCPHCDVGIVEPLGDGYVRCSWCGQCSERPAAP